MEVQITMEDLKLYDAEYRLLEIVWEKEPLSSTELYKECLPETGLEEIDHLHSASKAGRTENSGK